MSYSKNGIGIWIRIGKVTDRIRIRFTERLGLEIWFIPHHSWTAPIHVLWYPPTNLWKGWFTLKLLAVSSKQDLILWEPSSDCSTQFSPFKSPGWKGFVSFSKKLSVLNKREWIHLFSSLLLDRIQAKCTRISSAGFYLLDQRICAETAQSIVHPASWHPFTSLFSLV